MRERELDRPRDRRARWGHLSSFLRRERGALTSVFLSNLLLGVAGIVSGFVLARTLGPEGRGVLGSIQAVPSLVAGFTLIGLHEAVVYYGIKQPERRRAHLSTALLLSTGFAGSVALALSVLPVPIVDRSWAHHVYVLFVVLSPLTQIPIFLLQSAGRFTAWSILRSIPTMAWLLIALATIVVPTARTPVFVAMTYLAALLLCVPFFVRAGYRAAPPGPRRTPADGRQLLRFGVPIMLAGAPLALNLRLDVVIVSSMFDEVRIGYYVTAVAWGAMTMPVFSTLAVLALPTVARQESEGHSGDGRVLIGLALALVALVALVADPVTKLVFPVIFGDAYREAIGLASLALVAGAVQGCREVIASTLRGQGRVKAPLIAELVGLVVTAATLWVFLDRFGPLGGQWSSLLAYSTTAAVLLVAFVRKTRAAGPPRAPRMVAALSTDAGRTE